MFFRKLRWTLEWAATAGAAFVARRLRPGARLVLGARIGDLGYALDARHRRVALENLAAAYPARDPSWHRRTARHAFRHLGRLLLEICSQGSNEIQRASLSRVEGWENLREAAGGGKGYFLMSAHFGNWEWVANLQASRGCPLWMITRPLDNPLLEEFLKDRREGTGNRVVHKRNGIREMVRGIRAGQGIAILLDQNFGEEGGIFVPFFGRMAATTPALGRLATRMRVPVVPVFSFPEEDGGYAIRYGKPMDIPATGDLERDAEDLTGAATRLVQEAIERCPTAWFWMHQRWRTRPPGEEREPVTAPERGAGGDP